MLKRFLPLVLSLLALQTATVQADPWNGVNNPANMSPNYRYEFDALPLKGRVNEAHMPWSDNYWESDWGGISLRWNTLTAEQLDPEGTEALDKVAQFAYAPPSREQVQAMSKEQLKKLSPAEKYDVLMGRYDYPTVRAERERTHPSMDDWEGICHGWVPASINHQEPRPAELTNPDGVVVPFGSTDIKALLSHYYGVTAYEWARGNRQIRKNGGYLYYLDQFDSTAPAQWLLVPDLRKTFVDGWSVIMDKLYDDREYEAVLENFNYVTQIGQRPAKRDLFGVKNIKDPNAGAFHVVMTNQLALMNEPFVGNLPKKPKKAEIWNQPVVGYQTEILKDERRGGSGKVKVRTKLTYVSEIAQRWEPVVGTDLQRYGDMEFEYELDISGGRITGGKWESRAKHPSFVWKHKPIPIQGYFRRLNEISMPRF